MATSNNKETYSKFLKRRSSNVWDHFHRSDDGQSAKCQKCFKKLKTAGGSTTGLHVHLKTMHPTEAPVDDYTSTTASSVTPSTSTSTSQDQTVKIKKRKLMTDYFNSQSSIEAIVSRIIALDGASFRLLCESEDLRQMFKKSGYDLPKSPNTIAKMVLDYAEQIKRDTKDTIKAMKDNGERFTLTLDEWTSLRNRRYMNVNLHCRAFGGFEFKNLGLVKITGSLTATIAVKILREHLSKFSISLNEDVISHTTDGASVMKKMGSYMPGFHQLCLAHGVQLAVVDTLYKATTAEVQLESRFQQETEFIIHSSSNSDNDSDNECDGFEVETPRVRADPRLYKEVIDKVRCLIRSIKKSPLKADALRAYTTKQFGDNLQLKLDCKTRWSSLNDMVGSFLKIKDCIFKLLIDIKSDITFNEIETETLSNIHQTLEVVKLAVLSLCRRDATLYTADVTLKFMLKKLEEQDTYLSTTLLTNLKNRIKERRLVTAGVLHYLHDSESFYSTPDDDIFPKPTSDEICNIIVDILNRLENKGISTGTTIPVTDTTINYNSSDEDDEPLASLAKTNKLTLHQELDKEIEKCKVKQAAPPYSRRDIDLKGFVVTEKAIYDNKGERGVYLTQAYQYLSSVLPTSVESERIFSAAGYFCNKIRSSLSDRMLDALLLLRTHFKEQRTLKK